MKKCRVHIRSKITRDGETDCFELDCPGEYGCFPDRTVIEYEEEQTELLCRVIYRQGRAFIRRGDMLDMTLVPGEKRAGSYDLPFGSIDIEYSAKAVVSSLGSEGGTLALAYVMDLGGAASENETVLTVMPDGQ